MANQFLSLELAPGEAAAALPRAPAVILEGPGWSREGEVDAVLGVAPRAALVIAADGTAVLRREGREERLDVHPLDALDAATRRLAPPPSTLARGGGWIGYLAYDLRHWVEKLPARARRDLPLPDALFYFFDALAGYEARSHRWSLVSPWLPAREVRERSQDIHHALDGRPDVSLPRPGRVRATLSRRRYEEAVERVLGYIAAGDVYQVNIAQRFSVHWPGPPGMLYERLTASHPVPHAAFIDAGDFQVISNSPECFLRRTPSRLSTYPIKGTRGRGADSEADAAAIRELVTDTKERAEHVMIVDVERNDLGRICAAGSVRVPRLIAVESFGTLHHLVSTVEGSLPGTVPLGAVLRATFPGGSITGAPKIRAMEIIDEIEPTARGTYTGAIGWVRPDGTFTFSIAIRTAVAHRGVLYYHAGGGIVADSDPGREYEECLLKGQAFSAALGTSLRP